jgi:hypothetical protein
MVSLTWNSCATNVRRSHRGGIFSSEKGPSGCSLCCPFFFFCAGGYSFDAVNGSCWDMQSIVGMQEEVRHKKKTRGGINIMTTCVTQMRYITLTRFVTLCRLPCRRVCVTSIPSALEIMHPKLKAFVVDIDDNVAEQLTAPNTICPISTASPASHLLFGRSTAPQGT